ncbi:hypothetical protein AB5J62_40360 [Amycolatopsis sp. cg5]|uniref:hypothetical protein n=1 Tax=Amycolatopsis sp. cg5 TaxID=3238802 RepID=UPI003523CBB9
MLAAAQASTADGRAHLERAKALLEDATRAIVEAQAKANPWLPPQLAQAIEQIDVQLGKLTAAGELLTAYQSRL